MLFEELFREDLFKNISFSIILVYLNDFMKLLGESHNIENIS